jgi:cell division protein FtsA
MGGQHITNDLAIGLRTDLDIAETVKLQHASLSATPSKRDIRIKVNNQDYVFKAEDIALITEARVEELFEYVNKELGRIHRAHKLPGGVVLVGGSAKLPGIADYAKNQLQLAARVGKLQPMSGLIDTVADPSYCTAAGLMLLDMLLMPEVTPSRGGKATDRTLHFVDSLLRRFRG